MEKLEDRVWAAYVASPAGAAHKGCDTSCSVKVGSRRHQAVIGPLPPSPTPPPTPPHPRAHPPQALDVLAFDVSRPYAPVWEKPYTVVIGVGDPLTLQVRCLGWCPMRAPPPCAERAAAEIHADRRRRQTSGTSRRRHFGAARAARPASGESARLPLLKPRRDSGAANQRQTRHAGLRPRSPATAVPAGPRTWAPRRPCWSTWRR